MQPRKTYFLSFRLPVIQRQAVPGAEPLAAQSQRTASRRVPPGQSSSPAGLAPQGWGRLPPQFSSCKQMRWPHRERDNVPSVGACHHQNATCAQPRAAPGPRALGYPMERIPPGTRPPQPQPFLPAAHISSHQGPNRQPA